MNIKNIKYTLKTFAIIATLSIGIFAQNNNLEGNRWKLVQINGQKVVNSTAFMEFNQTEKRISGNAGCNRMFGSFELTGKHIRFSKIGSTRIFCTDENAMKTEVLFLAALEKTTKVRKQGSNLKLYGNEKIELKFKAVKNIGENNSPLNLEDRKWVLETVKDKKVSAGENEATVIFDKINNRAGGNSSCNSYGGTLSSDGNILKITEIISTQRACVEEGKMNIERELFNGLQNSNRFEIKDGKLYLYQNTELMLTFRGESK